MFKTPGLGPPRAGDDCWLLIITEFEWPWKWSVLVRVFSCSSSCYCHQFANETCHLFEFTAKLPDEWVMAGCPVELSQPKPLVEITVKLSSKWTVTRCHAETIITKTPGDCIWLSCEVKTLGLKTSNDCNWNDGYWGDGWQSDFNRGLDIDWCLGLAYVSQRWDNDPIVSGFQLRVRDGDKCWKLSVVYQISFGGW